MVGFVRERDYVWAKYKVRVETCHVAHVKDSLGLTRGPSHNRLRSDQRAKPCPPNLWRMVEEAVRYVHADRLRVQ
jgi:hypothetical protein